MLSSVQCSFYNFSFIKYATFLLNLLSISRTTNNFIHKLLPSVMVKIEEIEQYATVKMNDCEERERKRDPSL